MNEVKKADEVKFVREWDELQFSDMIADVEAFHEALGLNKDNRKTPGVPSKAVGDLRVALVNEEYEELLRAHMNGDVVEVADAVADLIYVAIGVALAYGIDLRPVWAEVQRSNMAKTGGERRDDGKVLKPEGWTPPDIEGELRKQLAKVTAKELNQ